MGGDTREEDEKEEESEGEEYGEGEFGERIGLEDEGEFVRKMLDPRLPSREEVDRHWNMGHIPYRNWCLLDVRMIPISCHLMNAQYRSLSLTTVSLAMRPMKT